MQNMPTGEFKRSLSPERKQIIRVIFEALDRDYVGAFKAQFMGSDADKQTQDWKYRLAWLVRECPDDAVLDAFDTCCVKSPKYPPTLREIEVAAKALTAERKRSQENEERLRKLKETPSPTGLARLEQLREGAAKIRAGKQPFCDGDHEQFDRMLSAHKALVEPYSLSAQRLAVSNGANGRFRDSDYWRQTQARDQDSPSSFRRSV